MSRRKKAVKRQILPDPKFNNVLVTRFINSLMEQGKKSVAERIFYRAIDLAQERAGQEGIETFQKAVENVKPVVMILSRRIGGTPYQIPVEVRYEERTSRSIRWLIHFARERSERTMAERLANEFISASKGEGGAVRQRDDVHRMAEANKAFAHYRFR
ncbi:MAG: 30S ribosomal protein S7 [Candidatus Latescibacteria bacterium]|nr:30S ribosomal protein S7 [Candidatus Latescibacterota bacterium]